MKKEILLVILVLFAIAARAQYTFSGVVLNTSGAPISGKTVWVKADSTINPVGYPTINLSTTTNGSGAYSVTLPVSVIVGMKIVSSTVNCNSVLLTNTHTYAGVNISSNFTICITPAPTISGQITMGNSTTPASNAQVLLIEKRVDTMIAGVAQYTLKALDSVVASANGNYAFSYPTSFSGDLLVKAFLQTSSPSYNNYLPTYYTSSLMWNAATTLPLGVSSTPNITLQGGTNPGGPGFVSGNVVMGANKTTAVGDPLPNRLIILTDAANKAIAYTLSDVNGYFSFSNLPYGGYKIFGDVFSKVSTPLGFVLSTANPSARFIKFEEKARTFNASMPPTAISATAIQAMSIYPNPASNYITIAGMATDANITIYDMTGRIAAQHIVSKANNHIDIALLPAGSYILKLATAQDVQTMKFTKE